MLDKFNMSMRKRVDLREMEEFLIPNGEYVVPYYYDLNQFSLDHLIQFGHKHAMYTLPTIELIYALKEHIGDLEAIEIGSGCGVIGRELNIRATDNYCQERPEVKMYYQTTGQPTIKYGKNVVKLDAESAVKKLQPDIVIGSWITHKYCPVLEDGNVYGPNEEIILDNCKMYILLGNELTHNRKPITKHFHNKYYEFPGYVTRSINPEKNCVYIWKGRL